MSLSSKNVPQGHFLRGIVERYITKDPKLEASKELKKIVARLTSTTETRFINSLDSWYLKHEEFINDKSINPSTEKEYFTHRKLVAAYKSLRRNLPYLFMYKNYPLLEMVNTTNSLDGGVFTQLKKLTKLHQGITKSLKSKLIDDYLVYYNRKLWSSLTDFALRLIGIGATVFDEIMIGDNAIIGGGAVVTKDVAANTLVYGSPAKFIKNV